jgi:hypothetical protein
MTPHLEECPRRGWLLEQPKRGLLWRVLLQEGEPCRCSVLADAEDEGAEDDGRSALWSAW